MQAVGKLPAAGLAVPETTCKNGNTPARGSSASLGSVLHPRISLCHRAGAVQLGSVELVSGRWLSTAWDTACGGVLASSGTAGGGHSWRGCSAGSVSSTRLWGEGGR